MNEKLKFLWMNLVEFIVYYDEPNTVNAVVAIGHKEKGLIVIRPEYQEREKEIVATVRYICMFPRANYHVRYGEGFGVDTWNHLIKDFNPEDVTPNHENKKCPVCKGTGKWDDYPCPDCFGTGLEIPDKF